ncbi:MAG: hypothetical protein AB7V62_02795 [Thermoleophilia bacterium]
MNIVSRPARVLMALAALVVLAFGTAAATAAPAPFALRFSANAPGDVAITGNTVMTCPAANAACAPARAGAANQNNSFAMGFVDADSDPATFNSSSAALQLPPGSTILFAGLYWGAKSVAGGGSGALPPPNAAAQASVKFQAPGAAAYSTITGTIIGTTPDSGTNYHAFADVTAQVTAAGAGTYGVADVQAGRGSNTWGGWSLVVAYRDPAAPFRNLTVFDGYQFVASSNPAVNIPISGFVAPPAGPVRLRLGVVAYDGDKGSPGSVFLGDSFSLPQSVISDALSPANDFFNSTLSREGTRFTAKSPDYVNQLGFDAKVLAVDGLIANSETSTTIGLITGGESYYPGVVTAAIDLFAPTLTSTKTVTDVNGGQVEPGDVLEYAIALQNTGLDAAVGVSLTDPIPANTTYEAGSLQVSGGANTGPKTDAAGDDQAEAAGGGVTFRLGAGATAAAGGSLGIGESTEVRFRVRVGASTPAGTVIPNTATIDFTGATTGMPFKDTTAPATVTVVGAPRLGAAKTATLEVDADRSGGVSGGDTLRYSITVTNSGNQAATGVRLGDQLDPNTRLVNGSVTTTAGTVTAGNGSGDTAVGVAIGTLAPGASATIAFTAQVVNPLPPGTTRVLNQAVVDADGQPQVRTDDPVTVLLGDATTVAIGGRPAGARLAIDVRGPARARPLQVVRYCATVRNRSRVVARVLTIRVPVPAGTVVAGRPKGARIVGGRIVWTSARLAPSRTRTVCFRLRLLGPAGSVRAPQGIAVATNASRVTDRTRTRLLGRPGPQQPAVTG